MLPRQSYRDLNLGRDPRSSLLACQSKIVVRLQRHPELGRSPKNRLSLSAVSGVMARSPRTMSCRRRDGTPSLRAAAAGKIPRASNSSFNVTPGWISWNCILPSLSGSPTISTSCASPAWKRKTRRHGPLMAIAQLPDRSPLNLCSVWSAIDIREGRRHLKLEGPTPPLATARRQNPRRTVRVPEQ